MLESTDILFGGYFFSAILMIGIVLFTCVTAYKIFAIVWNYIADTINRNHKTSMSSASKNLAVDLQTNDLAKDLKEGQKEIKERLKLIESKIDALNTSQ